MVCAVFYLIGSDTLTAFLGNRGAELLKLMGTGSRFESITNSYFDILVQYGDQYEVL